MNPIIVQHNPPQAQLNKLGVAKWPTWEKEVSVFSWTFPEQEIAYIVAGECIMTPEGGLPITFGKGDLVTFPAGMVCSWEVTQPMHKHYFIDEGNWLVRIINRVKQALKS